MDVLCFGIFLFFALYGLYLFVFYWRRNNLKDIERTLERIHGTQLNYFARCYSYWGYIHESVAATKMWIAFFDDGLYLYPNQNSQKVEPIAKIYPQQIRGYWEEENPNGLDSLWIHIEREMAWYTLKLPHDMDIINAISKITPEEQEYSYKRDNYEVKILEVYPAEQDYETGGWILDESVIVYLSPLYLFVLDEYHHVVSSIPVRDIENIERRMHSSKLGILRMKVKGEDVTFAAKDGNKLADYLADISRIARLADALEGDKDEHKTVWKKKKMEKR